MQPIIRQIHNLLIKKHRTLCVAESCTGGLLSEILTRMPRSSLYFLAGAVTYSNHSKQSILGVPLSVIKKYGAVSQQTAALMAQKLRKKIKSDYAISISGIAGPGGGSRDKPSGTVFIALSSKNKEICRRFLFTGKRNQVRKKAALKSLRLLKSLLK